MQIYEEWKAHNYPNLFEVLEEFTTVDLDPAFLLINLPTVQARFYSISSSPDAFPNEVHATVAIVTYRTKGILVLFTMQKNVNAQLSCWLNFFLITLL